MTPSEAKKLLPIITAYAAGKAVQIKVANGKWADCADCYFTAPSHNYRIKPDPIKLERYAVVLRDPGPTEEPWITSFHDMVQADRFIRRHPTGTRMMSVPMALNYER